MASGPAAANITPVLGGLRIFAAVGAVVFGGVFAPPPTSADLLGHGGMVRAVDFSADGRRLVTGSFDFSAIVWNFDDQRALATLDGHAGPVTSVAFLPDGRVLTTSDDWKAFIWDVSRPEPKIVHRLEGHKHKIMSAAVSADGKRVVTGGWDKAVKVWDSQTGKQLRSISVSSPVNSVAMVGPAGRLIAVGGHDRLVRLLDSQTGRSLGALSGHKMGITQLTASVDGKHLLSASIDKSVRLWDVGSQKLIRILEHHESQVFGVRFLPDGKSAVSTGRDGFILIWDLDTGEVRRAIKAHDVISWSVAVSPDGRFAVSVGSDETARIWHMETGDRIGTVAEANNEPKPWLQSNHPGAKLYSKCARCHALKPGGVRRSGPHFEGLFGRPVGTVAGYRYSDALKGRNFSWNKETLFRLFDEGPDKFLPGTKMPVQRVSNPEKLAELVDYLGQLTGATTGK